MGERTFEANAAVRESVPLLVGIMGPSGGGKTFSALRLATGIQTVVGGDIYVIDTEARRALHYADHFKFKHVPFAAPFGSLDYLAALRFCVNKGGKVIVVDSMSHEHEGPGGMLDVHEKELDRLVSDNPAKRGAMNALAYQKPKRMRGALLTGILQLEANFVFCFRAKEKIRIVKVNGKTEVIQDGFMPIAGKEFVFEQTVNCLLLPGAGGVPTWRSDSVGERQMMKLPLQFEGVFSNSKPLDESIGTKLAQWAKGGPAPKAEPVAERDADDFDVVDSDTIKEWLDKCEAESAKGMDAMKAFWRTVPPDVRADPVIKARIEGWRAKADAADAKSKAEAA